MLGEVGGKLVLVWRGIFQFFLEPLALEINGMHLLYTHFILVSSVFV
jgi:hypothetical protein